MKDIVFKFNNKPFKCEIYIPRFRNARAVEARRRGPHFRAEILSAIFEMKLLAAFVLTIFGIAVAAGYLANLLVA